MVYSCPHWELGQVIFVGPSSVYLSTRFLRLVWAASLLIAIAMAVYRYCSLAYSALASFRMGMSECGSAFFQSDDSIEGADSVPNPETQNFVGCNSAKAYECSQKFSIIHMLALKVH